MVLSTGFVQVEQNPVVWNMWYGGSNVMLKAITQHLGIQINFHL